MDMKQKGREYYITNIHVGNIIAFNVVFHGDLIMLSGKVKEIIDDNTLAVQTKNGSIFFPKVKNVVWVKTGTRWPIGIYNALKYGRNSL